MKPDALTFRKSLSSPRTVVPCMCAALTLIAASAAHAQTSPYSLRLAQRVSVDTNIFRVTDGNEQRDYLSTTAITFGLDQPISRQRLYASATADYTAYKGNDQLNGPGYSLIGGLGWALGSRLTGDAQVNFRQSQAIVSEAGALASQNRIKNKERSGAFDLRGAYGGMNLLAIEALYNHTNVSYSNAAFATRERESDTLGAGVRIRPSPDWTYGVMWRETRGEYPQGIAVPGGFIADEYDRRDIDFSTALRISDLSSLVARLSYTKEDHQQATVRSFSGVTGEIGGTYRPTGKLEFSVALSRDTGSGTIAPQTVGTTSAGATTPSGAVGGTGFSAASDGYLSDARVSNRLRVQAAWEATAKVGFLAGLSYSRDRYDSLFVGGTGGAAGQENGNSRAINLAARYSLSRAVSFECGASRESRDAGSASGVVADFNATTAFCGAALLIQ